ncbi:MAG TPA: GlsB/YeaQ/YmgE family stress response membrane protein [Candidatus Paceibacterota bacterium]|nr:GlsB/YeaQ/YmgE family stress response membrane protein [Candidatus Paceibacterota bacterium]
MRACRSAGSGITTNHYVMDIIAFLVVGIVGALVGGLIFNAFGSVGVTGFNIYSLLVATIGAIVALWVLRMVRAA